MWLNIGALRQRGSCGAAIDPLGSKHKISNYLAILGLLSPFRTHDEEKAMKAAAPFVLQKVFIARCTFYISLYNNFNILEFLVDNIFVVFGGRFSNR